MHHATDAEDKRLLEAGDHRELLENYVHLVREWAFLRTRDREAADEVAQQVFLRLAEELDRERRYGIPFRAVVWNVVRWTAAGHDWRPKDAASLPESWDPPADDQELERWAVEHDFRLLLADFAQGERDVAELIYVEQVSHEQAAARLGITRNAVDQRLHRANRKLAERLLV